MSRDIGTELCEMCMDFCHSCDSDRHDIEGIKTAWNIVFVKVCEYLGIDEKSADILFDDMCCGNWDRLHLTSVERAIPPHDWFDCFIRDVFYCSDRWSFDRLMHTHWMYKQWVMKIEIYNDIESY